MKLYITNLNQNFNCVIIGVALREVICLKVDTLMHPLVIDAGIYNKILKAAEATDH